MGQLLPDRLTGLWRAVDENQLSVEAFTSEQERLLDDYRRTWTDALILEGTIRYVRASSLSSAHTCLRRPRRDRGTVAPGVALLKGAWQAKVIPSSGHSIEQFYDESQNTEVLTRFRRHSNLRTAFRFEYPIQPAIRPNV